MNHLKNHFVQKGTVIFIAILLLTIPNISVYSAIGDYQTSSMAITANNKHTKHKTGDHFSLTGLAVLGVMVGVLAIVSGAGLAYGFTSNHPLITRPGIDQEFDKRYVKYDFSQFDN